jgi:hypothetical protein
MNEIEEFKKSILEAMKENFEKDGFLAPVFFFIKGDRPGVAAIPGNFFEDSDSKIELISVIKSFCVNPDVKCAGIAHEAWARGVDSDSELGKLLMDGNLRVSELKEKSDIIFMIFATPDKEELYSYHVDIKNKKVGEQIAKGSTDGGGLFSNFFEMRKKVN